MIYTDKDIYDIIDFAVDKNIMVYDSLANSEEITPRFLGLLRKTFIENYMERPTHLLIDKNHEADLELLSYKISLINLNPDLPIKRILNYDVVYVENLQKIAEQYQKDYNLKENTFGVFLSIRDKNKLVIARNDKISLLGIY